MPRVPMEDSLIGPPVGLVRQIRLEGTRGSDQNSNCSPSDFLVTDLELDGIDLGPMIKYTKEILLDDTEKQFDGRVLSISDRTRSGHHHRCHVSPGNDGGGLVQPSTYCFFFFGTTFYILFFFLFAGNLFLVDG